MTAADGILLLPLIVLSASAIAVMLAGAFLGPRFSSQAATILGLVLAFLTLPLAWSIGSARVTALLLIDHYALLYMGLLIAASGVVVILAEPYLAARDSLRQEFYALVLLATLGSAVLVASSHFASFFLGLEVLSISLYGLIAYTRICLSPLEAGLKYLVLAATSAAFLLFGMALVYAQTGSMDFARLAALRPAVSVSAVVTVLGLGLIGVGVAFKLAVFPFHMWTPDVYEGAPAPVSALVATISKAGMFGLLLRFFTLMHVVPGTSLFVVLAVFATGSMAAGNLLGLLQRNLKRLMAYSSIAHLGYLIAAFLAGGALGLTAGTFYVVAYVFSTLAVFGVIILLSPPDRDADRLEDYQALARQQPRLAAALTAGLLSLAGIPFTAGFMGKFFIVAADVTSTLWWLAIVLVVTSVVGLFYYLRVLWPVYAPEIRAKLAGAEAMTFSGNATALVLAAALVWLGIYPTPLLDLIRMALQGVLPG